MAIRVQEPSKQYCVRIAQVPSAAKDALSVVPYTSHRGCCATRFRMLWKELHGTARIKDVLQRCEGTADCVHWRIDASRWVLYTWDGMPRVRAQAVVYEAAVVWLSVFLCGCCGLCILWDSCCSTTWYYYCTCISYLSYQFTAILWLHFYYTRILYTIL